MKTNYQKLSTVKITYEKSLSPSLNSHKTIKFYFVKIELFTPACSHFLTIGLRNDIGRAVKKANETTNTKSVVK